VPQRAVMRGPNGVASVMVVTAENKVEPREIQAEATQGDKWIVTGGLKAGERVIVEGLLKAMPGAVVVPVPFNAPRAGVQAAASSRPAN